MKISGSMLFRWFGASNVCRHMCRSCSGQQNVYNAVSYWSKKLQEAKIPEPEVSVQLIIAHVFGKKMIHEVPFNQLINREQHDLIDRLCNKRLKRMPVQYVIEEWDFHNLTLKMRPPVFIPRDETAELGEHVCKSILENITQLGKFLEFGSGSGALSLYILSQCEMMQGVAIDKCREACKLTTENAEIHGLLPRLSVLNMDYSSPDAAERLKRLGLFDVLVANPPYIPTAVVDTLETDVISYEDRGALDGGEDGLDFVKKILDLAKHILKPGGNLWMEVDLEQTHKIKLLVEQNPDLGLVFMSALKDFTDRERFCLLEAVR